MASLGPEEAAHLSQVLSTLSHGIAKLIREANYKAQMVQKGISLVKDLVCMCLG